MYRGIFLLLSLQMTIIYGASRNYEHNNDGYSFHEFRGPLSGEIHEVKRRHGPHGILKTDYIAKPDYKFAYGVEEPQSGTAQAHQESRNGDEVHGEYSVLQADGNMRIVRYTADPVRGFQAIVEYKRF